MDYRAKYVNITCKLFYNKHSGNLDSIIRDKEFIEYYKDTQDIVDNAYEVSIDNEVPLFVYYEFSNMSDEIWCMNKEFYDTELSRLDYLNQYQSAVCRNMYCELNDKQKERLKYIEEHHYCNLDLCKYLLKFNLDINNKDIMQDLVVFLRNECKMYQLLVIKYVRILTGISLSDAILLVDEHCDEGLTQTRFIYNSKFNLQND